MNIYVGNLSEETSVDDLRRAFEGFGQVADVTSQRAKRKVVASTRQK